MAERDLPSIHDRASLLTFIRSHLDARGRFADPMVALPDEAPLTPGGITFAAGAFDGIIGHHAGAGASDVPAAEIAELIVRAAGKPTKRRLRRLYDAVNNDNALTYIDALIKALAHKRPPVVDVARIGTWLASASPDRGPVKVGIALLGIAGAPDGVLLHDLGAHEEFTLFAAVAFANSRSDAEADLFKLARRVDGWGRIHCVERLRNSTNPEIARWILREGFRNRVMNEYLAYIAATTGDLAAALATSNPDRELLTAAGEIIEALIMGGPTEDIDDYRDGPVVLTRWLDHMDDHAETLGDIITISTIREFCDSGPNWDHRLNEGSWTATTRDALRSHAEALLALPRWARLVEEGLASPERVVFGQAEQAARVLGIDTFAQLLERIDADPIDGPWYQAWNSVDVGRAAVLADRAATLLDLGGIATGPADSIGMGTGFGPHMALGWTLQRLGQFPGIGENLVAVGLQSPSIQNRNGALNVLEAWGRSRWNEQHLRHVHALAAGDPSDRVRTRAAELLNRQS